MLGIGIVAAVIAAVFYRVLTKKEMFVRAAWTAKARPVLLFIAVAGGLGLLDVLLGIFGWSLLGIYNGLVKFIASLGVPDAAMYAKVLIGGAAALALINVIHDLWPKSRAGRDTEASAVLLAVVGVLGVGGVVGKLLQGLGRGLGTAANNVGTTLFGG